MKDAPNFQDLAKMKVMMADGMKAKEIAEKLRVGLPAIENHFKHLSGKVKPAAKKKAAPGADVLS